MWKALSDWLLAFLNMTRELHEHRMILRRLDERMRNMEEAIKLLAQEQRHGRELESAEREKLLLQVDQKLTGQKTLPARRTKRRK